ncbi:MAG: 23S rRNA (adenine(2503)-C(2))-methyltransferase RlmN [Spartobacteria bacterium]|nr:23S rRNA (adenine(2503)-C(2))-methyltransferase RlmN [Spartobacteria bacterium]
MTLYRLLGCEFSDIQHLFSLRGEPRFRAKQTVEWLYKKHCVTLDDMTNFSKKLREQLHNDVIVGRRNALQTQCSVDGTKKYLFPTETPEGFVETAMIPDDERATLCLSTQIGCKRKCAFCVTGKQGLCGQLTAGDMINQYASCPERDRITNIVFMGMGEPLDNYENVSKALRIFTEDWGYAKSPSRLTISTVGIIPQMRQFLVDFRCHLAISMHSPFHEQRLKWMPVEKQYPLQEVIDVLREYDFSGQRRLTFEYALFDQENDSIDHARAVLHCLRGLDCRVNLIPCNPSPHSPFRPTPFTRMEAFQNILKNGGIVTTIRKSKGRDIDAACGLLSTKAKS